VTGQTGGYYWLPSPGDGSLTWEVVTCHLLGFDSEAGHVEMWQAVIDRLASAWTMFTPSHSKLRDSAHLMLCTLR
jgi:hypothetical protein